ncbi:unnamed protein product, partial [Vitis vinifera]|uniref:Uncharacterized protein n=1 Tax=Vitis vinifera TaxID=29760 RepID=D7SUX2_VITVI
MGHYYTSLLDKKNVDRVQLDLKIQTRRHEQPDFKIIGASMKFLFTFLKCRQVFQISYWI